MLFENPAPFILLAVSVTAILTLVILTNRLLGIRHDIKTKKRKVKISQDKQNALEEVCLYIAHLATLTLFHLIFAILVAVRIILERFSIESPVFDVIIALCLAGLLAYWTLIFLIYFKRWVFRLRRREQ